MKNIIKFIGLILLLVKVSFSFGQDQAATIRELKVGDKCPDFIFKEIINSSKSNGRLSDYKGKLVIVDFFATWCGPCIEGLPKMDSLQRLFGDKIAILPVTRERKHTVMKLLKANRTYKSLKLPFVILNTELDSYFPHRSIPHEVWIDQNGIVKSITSDLEVTERNIQLAIDGKSFAAAQKFEIKGEDFNKPLLGGGIGKGYTIDSKDIAYSALITRYIDGSAMQPRANLAGGNVTKMGYAKMVAINATIDVLYRTAFMYLHPTYAMTDNPDVQYTHASRTLWEAKDTSFYYNYGNNKSVYDKEIYRTKSFSYEFIAPLEDSAQIAKFAIQELNNYFGRKLGIEAVKENRTVMCWVLRKTASFTPLTTTGTHLAYNFDNVGYKKLSITNGSINWFFTICNGFLFPYLKMPMVDETGINGNIDLALVSTADLRSLDSINKALSKYGLEFIEAERNIDMIIIRDKKVVESW